MSISYLQLYFNKKKVTHVVFFLGIIGHLHISSKRTYSLSYKNHQLVNIRYLILCFQDISHYTFVLEFRVVLKFAIYSFLLLQFSSLLWLSVSFLYRTKGTNIALAIKSKPKWAVGFARYIGN